MSPRLVDVLFADCNLATRAFAGDDFDEIKRAARAEIIF
jgi:hypothetical protein